MWVREIQRFVYLAELIFNDARTQENTENNVKFIFCAIDVLTAKEARSTQANLIPNQSKTLVIKKSILDFWMVDVLTAKEARSTQG